MFLIIFPTLNQTITWHVIFTMVITYPTDPVDYQAFKACWHLYLSCSWVLQLPIKSLPMFQHIQCDPEPRQTLEVQLLNSFCPDPLTTHPYFYSKHVISLFQAISYWWIWKSGYT